MAVIAANSVTSNVPANAASGNTRAGASASGDAFAAMLDQLAQGPTNDMATVSTDAVSAGDAGADPQDDATAIPASDDPNASTPVNDPLLAQLLAAQQAATNTPAPASNTPTATSSDTTDTDADALARPAEPHAADTADVLAAASDQEATGTPTKADPNVLTKPTLRQNPLRDPGQQPDDRVSAKDHHRTRAEDALASDPSQSDPSQATDTTTPPSTGTTTGDTAVQAIPSAPAAQASAEAVAAMLPATNQAASGIVASGATTKPGKATSGVASNDSSKNENRSTKASALADAGDVTKRGFASEPLVRANALPAPDKAADADKPASNGTAAEPPQHNAANPAAIAASSQPEAAPVQQASPAAPVQGSQPAPQTDPGVSITTLNAGASPTQTPTTATPAHLAAQIQIAQHAPDVGALAVNIAAKSEDGQRHFDIRLDPAELGRVDVRLTVDDAGKAQAMLSVEKPQTLELLQRDQGHLERALKDAGLDLTQNGLSFSLKGQQQQQSAQDHTPFARGQRLAARAMAAIDPITPTLSTSGIAASDTRLDIRV